MNHKSDIRLGAFRLDLDNECLWLGAQVITLRPKAFAVLHYLVRRPGQLVSKEELLNAVWPETFVGDAVLKVAIRQLREALADNPKMPRFIETAHRRGYRFIGQLGNEVRQAVGEEADSQTPLVTSVRQAGAKLPAGIVGREDALGRLEEWLAKSGGGERQMVFISGEAGIGKTALVDTFARHLAAERQIRISRGQCLEQYGTGEAYLPVLEAIGRLCRGQRSLVEVLRAHAPLWLLQMPSLINAEEREVLSRQVVGATRERMLREMSDALEALSAEEPLVLILEDLHWSDHATTDLLSYVARQRQAARLMIIGTYRMAELIVSRHPLKAVKQELLAKQQCEELPLEYLSEQAIGDYLEMRFPGNHFPRELAGLIHERTEGNALFMSNTVEYLVAEGCLEKRAESWELVTEIENLEVGVPESIKQMIEKQLDHLTGEERRLLEAASVAGAEFLARAVAAGLGVAVSDVEGHCEELARRHLFLEACGVQELPSGEVASRYGFRHALYRNVLYEQIGASRRVQLHRRIGEQGEVLYGERVKEIAAELAMHFERGANFRQASKYLQQAADTALRRFAYEEAVGLARHGLALLERLPDSEERATQELCLQLTLGVPLIATEGYAAAAVGRVYLRARELFQQVGETPDISEVLWGLRTFYTVRAELNTAREIAEEFLSLAERLPYAGLRMRGHLALEITYLHQGEFGRALAEFEQALSLYDPERHREDAFLYAQNPGVAMRCFAAWALWFLGKAEAAAERMQEALSLARELGEPQSLGQSLFFAAMLSQLRREGQAAQKYAEAAIAVATDHGLVLYQTMAIVVRGWAQIEQGVGEAAAALEEMRRGLAAQQITGAEVLRPHFLVLLAEALGKAGQEEEGYRVLEAAQVVAYRHGECCYQAEIYRLKGELLVRQARARGLRQVAGDGKAMIEVEPPRLAHAECCYQQALKIARQQQAKVLELRAQMSLARLYQDVGRGEFGRKALRQLYQQFTEGFDTVDLCEAKALLDDLS